MRRTVLLGLVALIVVLALAAPAMAAKPPAYVFPSTNALNQANGWPHVIQTGSTTGSVTLQFLNDTNALALFEYRVDGKKLTSGYAHPVVLGDFMYRGVLLDSRGIAEPVMVTNTFTAKKTVEVRLALGGERDWDFDWVTFAVAKK